MPRTNFHETSYGWNYFFETAKTGNVRVGRYHTNGWKNENEQIGPWLGIGHEVPKDSIDCQRLFHK